MHFRHDWQEVARVFNPPVRREFEVEGGFEAVTVTEKAVHGFTRVEYRCRREGCEKRKAREFVGRLPE